MSTQKIVMAVGFGELLLSEEAEEMLLQLHGVGPDEGLWVERDDPQLVKVVETLGKRACGKGTRAARLMVVELPVNVMWEVIPFSDDDPEMIQIWARARDVDL